MGAMEEEPQTVTTTPFGGYLALRITNIVVCSVVVLLCGVLVLSMTLPLLSPKRRTNYRTYNLYLAYLAIPDGVLAGYVLYLCLVHQNIDPLLLQREMLPELSDTDHHPTEHSINICCGASNMYTNTFLTYEIYRLLKHSSLRKRHSPPTVARVTKQAGISYALGMLIAVVDFVWRQRLGDVPSARGYYWLQVVDYTFVAILPSSCMLGISAVIAKQQLLHTKGSMYGGKLRVLILYFFRIILTDVLFWLPCSTLYLVYMISYRQMGDPTHGADNNETTTTTDAETNNYQVRTTLARNVSLLFHGLQTMVNFGFCLTKPDARRLIGDIVRCACFGSRGACGDDDPVDPHRYGDPTLRSSYLPTMPAATDWKSIQNEEDSSSTANNHSAKSCTTPRQDGLPGEPPVSQ